MPWRSRWSGSRLSRTAHSGANSRVSSSWKDEHSQTTTALASCSAQRQRRVGGADVADDVDRHAGRPVQVAEQLGRRRLPVGAGDRDDLVGDAAPGQLQLAEDGDPTRARRGDHGRVRRDARRLDHGPHALQQRDAVAARVDRHFRRDLVQALEPLARARRRRRSPPARARAAARRRRAPSGRGRRSDTDRAGAAGAASCGRDGSPSRDRASCRGMAARLRRTLAAIAHPPWEWPPA